MRFKTPSSKMIRNGALIAFSISLFTLVIMLWSNATPKMWQGLTRFNPSALFLVVGLVFLSWIIEGLRVQLISQVLGEHLTLRSILSINLATLFTGNISPFTSAGAPTQVYLLHKNGLSVGKATVVVTLRMAISTLCFTIGGPILIFIFQGEILRRLSLQAWAGPIRILVLLALAFSAGMVFVLMRPAKGESLANWLFGIKWIRRLLGEKADSLHQAFIRELTDFRDSLLLITQQKKLHLVAVMIYTFLYWVVFFSIAPAILLGFGFSFHSNWIWFITLQFVLSFLISFVPIPGGSGVAEMGFYSVFAFFVPKHLLAIFVALWRVISYHLSTFVGGVFFLKHFKEKDSTKMELDSQG
ncbi:MAG TPA: flippase-like domain-containing protein [Bacillota bacterium]|nr:flippase-like domain-containing protein [Bacillota bacterium]